MDKHKHRFQRLSDEAIFCECGEVKWAVEPICMRPHYYPTWVWPYPYTTPTYPTSPFIWTTGWTTSAPFPDGTSITYTLSDGTAG